MPCVASYPASPLLYPDPDPEPDPDPDPDPDLGS
jgi:hypothetical protein